MRLFNWLRRKEPRSKDASSGRLAPLAEDEDVDPFNPFPEPIEHPLSDVIDLHTIPARDVKRVVIEYLHQAHESRFPVVRIIHGKGVGVQRELVRSVLARTEYVEDWVDAPPEAGGLGATIVSFKRN
jgi:dsDNA-specific endonuclease/ATPase MutS2